MRLKKRNFFCVMLIGLVIAVYSLWYRSIFYEFRVYLDHFDLNIIDDRPAEIIISAEPFTSVDMRGWMEFKHKIIHFEYRNDLIHLPNNNPDANRNRDGYLETYIWWESCYTSIHALKAGLGFPYSPHVILETQSLYINRNLSSYAERIFGYITPIIDGTFCFSLTTYDQVEVWLSSDSNPHNSQLIISTDSKQANRIPSQQSKPILLSTTQFYLEIIHISTSSDDLFILQWRPPNQSRYINIPYYLFEKIPPLTHDTFHSTLPMHFVDTSKYAQQTILTRPSQRIPQRVYKDFFPTCLSTDVLPLKRSVAQYSGMWELVFTKVYPDDRTQEYNSSEHKLLAIQMYGNEDIPQEDILDLMFLFLTQTTSAFSAKNLTISHINSVQQKHMRDSKIRYLIDLTLEDKTASKTYRFVDYFFIENTRHQQLCTIPSFTISQDIQFVYFIIIVKDLAQPLLALIIDLENLYYKTGDKNYGLIVVDFGSTDKDISSMLSSSHLKNYKYISMSGPFIKVQGQNAALQSVTDDDVILFLCDLHLHIPVDILDDIRTHTIKGISAYAPIVFRLACGHSLVNPVGYWEVWGGGLFAMYRSDWGVLGGMDTEHYSSSWGGEDSDLIDRTVSLGYEIERKGLPGLVHFYHTHVGLWDE